MSDPVADRLGVDHTDGCQTGVDWLVRLRQLQREHGHDFDTALAIANAEFADRG